MKKVIIAFIALVLSSNVSAQKIGHVYVDSVLTQLPQREAAQKELERYTMELQKEMENMVTMYREKAARFEKESKSLPEEIRQSRYKELMETEQNIQQFQVNAQQKVETKEEELLNPLLTKVQNAINKVCKDNNYNYVINSSYMLYVNGGNDLTPLVMKELGIK
jgi:outer membrane protein